MSTSSVMGVQPRSDRSSGRSHLTSLIPILVIYVVLAFHRMDHQSFWEDEYLSLLRLLSPHPIWKDGHGFIYFVLLKLWIQLGDSEFILRSLSALLGAIAVCLMYGVGVALLNRRAAVFATALFATSPLVIWYSQEVRYITLTLATTLLSMYALHRLFTSPSFSRWLAYASATLLAFFSFVPTLVLPLIQVFYLLAAPSRRPLVRQWIVCQIVILLVFSWWFVNGTHFLRAIVEARDTGQEIVSNVDVFPFTAEFNEVRAAVIPYTFFVFSAGFTIGPTQRELYAKRSFAALAPHAGTLLALAVFYGFLLVSGWLALWRIDSGAFLLLWTSLPVLAVFGVAKSLDVFYDVRYVSMALPAYMLVLAAGIARFRKPAVQTVLLAAVLVVHGISLANYYFDPRYAREDTRSAAKFLESKVAPEDVALVVGTLSSLPYYYKRPLSSVGRELSNEGNPALRDKLRELAGKRRRLWLVQIRPWQTDRDGMVQKAMDRRYDLLETQEFPGVDIRGYRVAH